MYAIKRLRNGRIGNSLVADEILPLKEFDTKEEAVAEMKARRIAFGDPKFNATVVGDDTDYVITIGMELIDCEIRYWVERVNTDDNEQAT